MTQDQVQAGERVLAGRYAMLSEIGRGGMGIVWLAEDRMIGRRVAIKELHLPDDVAPAEKTVYEERVLREARAAGRLNDPGVVTVYDVLRESDTTFIVMELIEATTLSQLVADQGPLAQDTVARLADQLLDALQSAHAAGVVHRDVKPSNIMVLPNGRVKLTDFGIAQSTDDPHLTTSGILVGSPVYMAPERLRGEDADAGSDLWALGAVLFFAVEGYAAFERSSTAATMHAILNEVPYLTRCHGPLAAVVTGLLNAHPEARPSAAQVRGLLAQATGTPPEGITAAVTTPTSTPGARRSRRSRPVIAAAAVVAVALLVAGYFVRVAVEGPEPPADMDPTVTYGIGEDGYIKELTWDSSPEGGCLISELVAGQADHAEPARRVHGAARAGVLRGEELLRQAGRRVRRVEGHRLPRRRHAHHLRRELLHGDLPVRGDLRPVLAALPRAGADAGRVGLATDRLLLPLRPRRRAAGHVVGRTGVIPPRVSGIAEPVVSFPGPSSGRWGEGGWGDPGPGARGLPGERSLRSERSTTHGRSASPSLRAGAVSRVIAGRYAVIRELGRGGMGVVWLAEDRMIGRRVAIKELHLPDGSDVREQQVLEERVLREARAAGRLNDPGVVTVYDVLRESGTTFIVMELIQAPTLSEIVTRRARCRGPSPGSPSSCCPRWRPRTRRVSCTGTSNRRTSWCRRTGG